MAYRSMLQVIKNGRQTKEQLLNKCDVFLSAGRITEEQYEDLVTRINEM